MTMRATVRATMTPAMTHVAALLTLAIASDDDDASWTHATGVVDVAAATSSSCGVVETCDDARHVEFPNRAGRSVTLEPVSECSVCDDVINIFRLLVLIEVLHYTVSMCSKEAKQGKLAKLRAYPGQL